MQAMRPNSHVGGGGVAQHGRSMISTIALYLSIHCSLILLKFVIVLPVPHIPFGLQESYLIMLQCFYAVKWITRNRHLPIKDR